MGVYVKGMKMPQKCQYCGFCRHDPENGDVWCNAENWILEEGQVGEVDVWKPKWCPLVRVDTPHGRLIDGDKLISEDVIPYLYHFDDGSVAVPIIDIKGAPVVIRAEEEEE